jgi:hypothetical protein
VTGGAPILTDMLGRFRGLRVPVGSQWRSQTLIRIDIVKESIMKTAESGRNRLTRTAAKQVPHRSHERFYAARADVKRACEDLIHLLRMSTAHQVVISDFMTAVMRVEHDLHALAPDEPKVTSAVREMGKEVQHLQVAQTWVAAADRVLDRLGTRAPHGQRDALLEARERVMWCVRAQHWDGELTSTTTQLQSLVQDAEATAARVAS